MYASHCLYICSPPLHARVPHITSALPSVYAVPRCTTGLYSSRYCHHRRTLPLHCGTVIPAGPYPSWYRRPHGRPLSFNDMTSTPRLHPIFVVAPQSAQLCSSCYCLLCTVQPLPSRIGSAFAVRIVPPLFRAICTAPLPSMLSSSYFSHRSSSALV
jgi:hypothetical protein